ncbi:hypothetical protein HZS_485 [Henneguya salminicola]|nr:hypothetical protein HZS_485 [Henneguya salminicola]
MLAAVGLSFCTFTLPLDPLIEKLSGFQKTQYLIGLNKISYWLSYYIMHMLFYLFSSILCVALIIGFNLDNPYDYITWGKLFLTIFYFG